MSQTRKPRRTAAPKKRATVKRKPARKAQRQPMSAQLATVLPMQEDTIRRTGGWMVIALLATLVIGAAMILRLPQLAAWQLGEGVGRLGFTVERVEIQGIDQMERLPVYAVALDQPSMAMPNVDIAAIRARVEAFQWVQSARVTRRLPDTLVVSITERTPTAIWQHDQTLYLVDSEGEVLEEVALDAMPDLPLIIGPAANRQVASFELLMDRAPALRPMLSGATWVGNRRWDLRFQSGETLALPEGEEDAGRALLNFARMDSQNGLLGEGFRRFDMRVPDRFVVRVAREAEAAPAQSDDSADSDTI
ncbi:cell division protein FtsQ/DivIB [Parasphingopyxis lamellibrachiae]|uniref:Cell division protein FtsQ n=1 Tax=Parasphingopyxis lamellibrachiae TaxID=680125 RepID=A0A3D9FF17_9SPHN|nr:cell division protein FtsQ/DivIB [Parasphingopyxis lamellibrachiae]RED16410.1 cell division protein FtsQ [Parasphingopyxis lamellibrachiae]